MNRYNYVGLRIHPKALGQSMSDVHAWTYIWRMYKLVASTAERSRCSCNGCSVAIFAVPASLSVERTRSIPVGRQVITFVEAYKYIGVCHHRHDLWQADPADRCAGDQRSLGGMHRCLASLQLLLLLLPCLFQVFQAALAIGLSDQRGSKHWQGRFANH